MEGLFCGAIMPVSVDTIVKQNLHTSKGIQIDQQKYYKYCHIIVYICRNWSH